MQCGGLRQDITTANTAVEHSVPGLCQHQNLTYSTTTHSVKVVVNHKRDMYPSAKLQYVKGRYVVKTENVSAFSFTGNATKITNCSHEKSTPMNISPSY